MDRTQKSAYYELQSILFLRTNARLAWHSKGQKKLFSKNFHNFPLGNFAAVPARAKERKEEEGIIFFE